MGTLPKVLGFSLALTLVFTGVANLLPQVEGESPKEEKVDLGALTMESFVALGESTVSGKGTCTLCHNDLGRAPDILALNMVATAEERLADSRYQGKATDVESYLRESMMDPGVYVVAGFGKKGSNDTESPMPAVHKKPIELSRVQIDAVIAFLQSKDGNDVTVALPTDAPAETVAAPAAAPAAAASAEEAVAKYGCSACHTIFDTESPVGPNLTTVASRLSVDEIRQSIINPSAVIVEGFPPIMPPNFAERMTVKELELLVAKLAEMK
ncbi:MAG: c-type cytochrome [Motiliproteus sp.]